MRVCTTQARRSPFGWCEMARLTLVQTARANTNLATHRASATEGEAAKRLLESQGYPIKRTANGQMECRCPFHEGPGSIEPRHGTKFYVNATTSVYFCQSASCGERGNLQMLERHFGIDVDDDEYVTKFRDRDSRLKEFERNLVTVLREPFYAHGLTDATIERFRLGYEPEHTEERGGRTVTIPGRYVIPYLEGRRPKFFRYYNPTGDPKFKYTWEDGSEATLFNAQDGMGDADGVVYVCEGEQKAMMLVQLGYAAVAVPGAGQWKDGWDAALTHARKIIFVYDNDNPAFHDYDRPEKGLTCRKCAGNGLDRCSGHNPGQEAALARVERIGWRAKNVVLPLPSDEAPKVDVNDYFMRDGHSNADFAELATGKRSTPYKVLSLKEISETPPEEATFLIDEGILPASGRLLIAGAPKVGKSILVDNLALSLAAGIPFLNRFQIKPGVDARERPTRTLLLDRELSKWSLFSRLNTLMEGRPGYRAAAENLLVDHDHLLRLDQKNAYDVLCQLVEQNGAEVVIMDTAYKFFGGDVESSSSLMKAFEVLDRVLHETGCAFVMTHHLRKQASQGSRQGADTVDPDRVAGSFLWTGWPNATILLNYLDRSVENPFNAIATFTAFRDAAAPESLALYRDRSSISYTAIQDYKHEGGSSGDLGSPRVKVTKPTTEAVGNLLLELAPITEDEFVHVAAGRFGVSVQTLKPYFVDAMSTGHFEKTNGRPPIIKYKHVEETESWEKEHGLAERPMPEDSGIGLEEDLAMFDAAGMPS